jgi:hypothetical protein
MTYQEPGGDTSERFSAVESVATKIFDKLPDLADPQPHSVRSTAIKPAHSGDDQTNVVTLFNGTTSYPRAILSNAEKLLGSLLLAFEGRGATPQYIVIRHPDEIELSEAQAPISSSARDISYHAARRRSQLPEGIEALTGKPSVRSDDEMMASIRSLIEEQEREIRAIRIAEKREYNRLILPQLEPQEDLAPEPGAVAGQAADLGFFARLQIALGNAFRKDLFLAISLSTWSALALMVFIDPDLSSALFLNSAFLLFVSYCLFSYQPGRTARRRDGRVHIRARGRRPGLA